MSKPKKSAVDLDALIDANVRGHMKYKLTDRLADELRHFAKRADEGRPIKRDALVDYLRKEHNMPTIGPMGVAKLLREVGATPWFSV